MGDKWTEAWSLYSGRQSREGDRDPLKCSHCVCSSVPGVFYFNKQSCLLLRTWTLPDKGNPHVSFIFRRWCPFPAWAGSLMYSIVQLRSTRLQCAGLDSIRRNESVNNGSLFQGWVGWEIGGGMRVNHTSNKGEKYVRWSAVPNRNTRFLSVFSSCLQLILS